MAPLRCPTMPTAPRLGLQLHALSREQAVQSRWSLLKGTSWTGEPLLALADGDDGRMSAFAREVTDHDVKAAYAVDMSLGATAPEHFTVVRARDLDDVVEVLRQAQATGTPVVPQGARSGLAGGSVALEGGIVLNLEGLSAITAVDPVEAIAICGAGTITTDLKAAVAAAGLFYPPDPASSDFSTVGGNVATNAGG